MRSLLFVPAHDERKLAKGLACGADALILDLEDAVPEDGKAHARQACAAFVRANRDRMPLYVRVNGLATGHTAADLAAVVAARPVGLMLPKCESGRDVATLADDITPWERRAGLEPGTLRILPIVTETAASLFAMDSYRTEAGPRVAGLLWGGEDLAADIGAAANRDDAGRYTAPYQLARTLTLLAASAAQVPAVDAVYTDFRDPEGLRAELAEARRDGFTAKAAIHPDQVGPINEAFTPTGAELAWARRVVAAFESLPGSGAVALDGKMLDRPHWRSAQRLLARTPQEPAP